ncbi:MAG: GNAT family N-acetyltransferase [Caldilineaceae bacterium]
MNNQITYTNLRPEHAAQLRLLQLTCFPNVPPDHLFSEDELLHMATVLPDLCFVAFDGDKAVGMGSGMFVDFDFSKPQHTLDDIEGDGCCSNHNPNGEYYYGTDISVHPAYRRRGIGSSLYALRKDVVRRANKRGIIAGGEIPGYARYIRHMRAHDYIAKVVAGEPYDPTLNFSWSTASARGDIEELLPRQDHPRLGVFDRVGESRLPRVLIWIGTNYAVGSKSSTFVLSTRPVWRSFSATVSQLWASRN